MFASSPIREVDSADEQVKRRPIIPASRSGTSSSTAKNQADIFSEYEGVEEGSFTDDLSSLLLASPPTDNSSTETSNAAGVAQTVLKELTCGSEFWVDPLVVNPVVTEDNDDDDDAPAFSSVRSHPSNSSSKSHVSFLEAKDAMRTWLQTNPTFRMKEEVALVDDFHSPSTLATETATGSSFDLTETDNAAIRNHQRKHPCSNHNCRDLESSWDANTVPHPQNYYPYKELKPHKKKQQTDTTTTGNIDTAQSSSTNSSALGWIYNFFFTQCASGGTDLGLCSPTISTHVMKPLSKTDKQSHQGQNQQQDIDSTSTLGRAETASSEKLGIIAPPVILRRPTDPTFNPNVARLRAENVAKSPTSASF